MIQGRPRKWSLSLALVLTCSGPTETENASLTPPSHLAKPDISPQFLIHLIYMTKKSQVFFYSIFKKFQMISILLLTLKVFPYYRWKPKFSESCSLNTVYASQQKASLFNGLCSTFPPSYRFLCSIRINP